MTDEILYERRKLPVWALAKRSYRFVWDHARLLAVPFLLVLTFQILAGLVSVGLVSAGIVAMMGPWIVLLNLSLSLLIATVSMSFIVGLHRTVLLNEVRPGTAFLRWDRNLWNYLKAWLTVMLVGIAVTVAIGLVLFAIFGMSSLMTAFLLQPTPIYTILFLLFILGLCLAAKIGLAFPAAALGYSDVFHLSWRITKGNLLRLIAAFLLVSLPFLLASLLLLIPMSLGMVMAVHSAPRTGLLMLVSLLANGVLKAASISVLTVALSLSFFFLFKAADEAGDFTE